MDENKNSKQIMIRELMKIVTEINNRNSSNIRNFLPSFDWCDLCEYARNLLDEIE